MELRGKVFFLTTELRKETGAGWMRPIRRLSGAIIYVHIYSLHAPNIRVRPLVTVKIRVLHNLT